MVQIASYFLRRSLTVQLHYPNGRVVCGAGTIKLSWDQSFPDFYQALHGLRYRKNILLWSNQSIFVSLCYGCIYRLRDHSIRKQHLTERVVFKIGLSMHFCLKSFLFRLVKINVKMRENASRSIQLISHLAARRGFGARASAFRFIYLKIASSWLLNRFHDNFKKT